MGQPNNTSPGPLRVVLAWGVHLYTALGLVLAAGMVLCIFHGGGHAFRLAFALMLVATLVDATDGALARAVRIKEVLPGFDGRRLDDLVDFLTYVCLPLLLVWRAGLLPSGWEAWLLLPLLASSYGFCQVSAKTDDGYFLGFPSCWNLVAFYLYALQPLPGWFSLSVVGALAVLTFVPLRYLYPSQRGRLNRFTNVLAAVWVVLVVWVLLELPGVALSPASAPDAGPRRLVMLSLFFPAWYLGVSWVVSLRRWQRGRTTAKLERGVP